MGSDDRIGGIATMMVCLTYIAVLGGIVALVIWGLLN